MKYWAIGIVLFIILVVFSIPTFYQARRETKTLRTANHIVKDMIDIRFKSISGLGAHGVVFVKTDKPSYTLFLDVNNNDLLDSEDKILKKVFLADIEPGVILNNDLIFVFKQDRDLIKKIDNSSVILDNSFVVHIDQDNYEITINKLK